METRSMKRIVASLALCVSMASAAAAQEIVWLDALDLSHAQQEWGEPQARKSVEEHPLTIGGKTFEHGVGTHANGVMVIDLAGAVDSFEALVGVDDEASNKASVAFRIAVDGKVVFDSRTMRHEAAKPVALR